MGVVADVLFAIAVITLAAGTVAELQVGVGNICFSADGAAVVIGRGCFFGVLIAGNIEMDHLGLRCVMTALAAQLDPPGHRQQISHIRPEEKEVV